MKRIILAWALASFTITGYANETAERNVKFGFILGAGFGGDSIQEFEFDDGSTDSVDAGGGLFFGASVQSRVYQASDLPIDAKFGFSYMFDSVSASNGDASFSRFPIDLILMSQIANISFGAGMTYHLNPEYELDLDGSSGTLPFDDALGTKFELNYHFEQSPQTSMGIEYTSITYDSFIGERDGSCISITLKGLY